VDFIGESCRELTKPPSFALSSGPSRRPQVLPYCFALPEHRAAHTAKERRLQHDDRKRIVHGGFELRRYLASVAFRIAGSYSRN
jgi:hypothetical protein